MGTEEHLEDGHVHCADAFSGGSETTCTANTTLKGTDVLHYDGKVFHTATFNIA